MIRTVYFYSLEIGLPNQVVFSTTGKSELEIKNEFFAAVIQDVESMIKSGSSYKLEKSPYFIEFYSGDRNRIFGIMEDQLILEMKQGMVEAATEAMEAATEAAQTEAPATEAPVTERAEVTEPAANAEFPYDVVLTGELNMRSGPADDYAVTYALTEGDQVRVIGRVTSESGAWYRVQYQGDSGYAYEESLDLVNGELGVE